jgi:hypothetical protein
MKALRLRAGIRPRSPAGSFTEMVFKVVRAVKRLAGAEIRVRPSLTLPGVAAAAPAGRRQLSSARKVVPAH